MPVFLIPPIVAFVAVAAFVVVSYAAPGWKWAAVAAFLGAAFLQFGTRFTLAGLLLQIALALVLLFQRRFELGR